MKTLAMIAWIALICCYPIGVAAVNVSTIDKVEVTEGDDAVLKCNVTHSDGTLVPPCSDDDVQIEWLMNDSTIASCLKGSLDNYSRELKFDLETGSLTIHNTRTADAANFTCGVNGEYGYASNTTKLIVERALQPPANTSSTSNLNHTKPTSQPPANTAGTNNFEHTAEPSTKPWVGTNVIFNHLLGSSAASVALCALIVVSVLVIGLMKRRKSQSSADVKEYSVRFMRGIKDESASTSSGNAGVNLLGTSALYQELNLKAIERSDVEEANTHNQTMVTHSTVIAYADVHQDSLDARPPSQFEY